MLACLYAGYTTLRCFLNPKLGPVLPANERPTNMGKVWYEFFMGLVPPAALVFFALGSILFGLATPTEGAGMGAFGSIVLALAYKKMTFKGLKEALIKTFIKNKIPYREFKIKKINEEVLGVLFSYFMLETVIVAKLAKINPYDQPAVEQVKLFTKNFLS